MLKILKTGNKTNRGVMKIKYIVVDFLAGTSIDEAFEMAYSLAKEHNAEVHFKFNGVKFIAEHLSDWTDSKRLLINIYEMQLRCNA